MQGQPGRRRGEGQFRQEDDGQLLRAGDDEHLRQVVGEHGAQAGVEGGGEGRVADAGAQVGVVSRFDGYDGAGGCEERRVVREGNGAAEVGADADAGVRPCQRSGVGGG